jgi:hypothetical protein
MPVPDASSTAARFRGDEFPEVAVTVRLGGAARVRGVGHEDVDAKAVQPGKGLPAEAEADDCSHGVGRQAPRRLAGSRRAWWASRLTTTCTAPDSVSTSVR